MRPRRDARDAGLFSLWVVLGAGQYNESEAVVGHNEDLLSPAGMFSSRYSKASGSSARLAGVSPTAIAAMSSNS